MPLSWGITLKPFDKIIGSIHFVNIVEYYLAEIGYILNPEHWGFGYMHEALGACLHYGFYVVGLGRVRAKVEIDNIRSIKLLERNGFKKEALIEEADYGGRVEDIYYYSLTV